MHVQVNTDNHIEGAEELTRHVQAEVESTLGRFGERITRVEVHLTDESGRKTGGNDKRCLMEARLAGLQPIAASHTAPTLEQAIDGATEKLEKALNRSLERLGNPKGRTSYGGDQTT